MSTRGIAVTVLALLAAGAPLAAQQPGLLEVGTFGRFSRLDRRGEFDDALSLSGRVGLFILPQISVELDISRGRVEDRQGVRTNFTPFHAWLLYNRPVGARTDLVLGAGYAQFDYGQTDQLPAEEYGFGTLAGLRIGLGERAAFRVDGTVDVMPVAWNAKRGVLVRQPDGRRVATFRGRAHAGLQAGVSLLWNLRERRLAPPVPAVAEPAPAAAEPEAAQPAAQAAAQPAAPPEPAERAAAPAPPDRAAEEAAAAARAIVEEVVHFDYDRATIRPDALAALTRKAAVLLANPDLVVRVEGHADERGSTEYNLALGQRRADAVKAQLVRLGVAAERIEAVSLGESRPLDTAGTEGAWARNRRAEFRIVRGGEALRLPPQ